MEKKKLEILAPAGSFESLKAAVHAGADAVYMGGSRFGARAYAQNPEGDRLLEAIDYAHLYGVKLYLTVNTLLKDKELEGELYDYLKPCVEHGLDAVIVQDTGVMKCIQRWFPEISAAGGDICYNHRSYGDGTAGRESRDFRKTDPSSV